VSGSYRTANCTLCGMYDLTLSQPHFSMPRSLSARRKGTSRKQKLFTKGLGSGNIHDDVDLAGYTHGGSEPNTTRSKAAPAPSANLRLKKDLRNTHRREQTAKTRLEAERCARTADTTVYHESLERLAASLTQAFSERSQLLHAVESAKHRADHSEQIAELMEERVKVAEHHAELADQLIQAAKDDSASLKAALDKLATDNLELTLALDASGELTMELEGHLHELEGNLHKLQTSSEKQRAELLENQNQLLDMQQALERLGKTKQHLESDRRNIQRRLERRPAIEQRALQVALTNAQAAEKAVDLKQKGGQVKVPVRNLVRCLASRGVSTIQMNSVIHEVVRAFGFEVKDSISPRTISRIILEGLVAARMQLAVEMGAATSKLFNFYPTDELADRLIQGLTVAYDGTSIRHQQHESNIITLALPTYAIQRSPSADLAPLEAQKIVQRTLGVHRTSAHTSEEQANGFISRVSACFDLLARSSIKSASRLGLEGFALKLSGAEGDHAPDAKGVVPYLVEFKKRCAVKQLGEGAVDALTDTERMQAVLEALGEFLQSKGSSYWDNLAEDRRSAKLRELYQELAIQLGEELFDALNPDEQGDILFLAWTGCCMHKDMNVVKRGVEAMNLAWQKLGFDAPIALPNKFVAKGAPISAVTKQGQKEVVKAPCGAVRATILAGLMFNNRDDKVGFHDTYQDFFESLHGYSCVFPDTSNTRFQSHCAAAAELLVNLDAYIQFLELVRDSKTEPSFNNIELNLYNALHDVPTLTELAVLALRSQAIGIPYIGYVRTYSGSAVELGPFHEMLKTHLRKLIEDPGILIGSSASAAKATLLGQGWDRPDVAYCIWAMVPRLPAIEAILVEYLRGELMAWDVYTSEWASDGVIASATHAQRRRAHLPATNDACEGDLGQARVMTRTLNLDENQRNARVMWLKNHTEEFVKAMFTQEEHQFIMEEARRMDMSGEAKASRAAQARALVHKAIEGAEKVRRRLEKKKAFGEKLAATELCLSVEILARMTDKELGDQIDKWREVDKNIGVKSKRKKQEKYEAILAAIDRLAQQGEQGGSQAMVEAMDEEQTHADITLPDDSEIRYQPGW
jgi:hypothetical protein